MPGSPTVKFFKLVAATLVLAVAQLTWATDALLRIPGGLRWVSTGSETKVWGVGPTGRVYQFLNERWVRRPGTLAQLSVGIDGELWGVTDAQRVFRWDGRDWRRISGGLKQVAVGSAEHVWGLGPTGWVFQRVNDRWSRRPGTLTQLSVGADGTVWGLDEQHRALRWAGGDWEQVAAVFKSISVSDQNNVWGVGGRGELFRLTADGFQLERRKDAIRQISSAADGSVWVVNDQQEVFTWRTRYEWVATIAGEPRRAIVWAPRAHLGNPAPVVLFFHGRGNGLVSSEPGREFHRRWPEAYVVYGEGTSTFDDRSGIGWGLRFPHLLYSCGRRKDLDYFDALLDHLEQEQNVDLNRVYVAGHSSGGFFTFSLAELRADRIRAVAVNGAYPSYVPVAVHIDCGNTYRDAIGVRFAGNNPTAASVAVARGQRPAQED
ncbi:MAG: tectonin domain-containing protein [Pseudomonadota bacterium]